MPQVKQEIPTVDEVDIAVVGVSPARGPRLGYFEIVAAVGEVGSACHYFDVTDREMVIPAEMRAKMLVVDSTGMVIALYIIVLFFLSNFFVVSMLVLGKGGDQSREKQPSADGSNCCESFHVNLAQILFRTAERIAPSSQNQGDRIQMLSVSLSVAGKRILPGSTEREARLPYTFLATIFPRSSFSTYAQGVIASWVKTVSHFSGTACA